MKAQSALHHLLLTFAGFAVFLANPVARSQTQSSASNAGVAKSISFDIVSIRRSKAANETFAIASPQDGDSITVTNMSPHMMIGLAYGLVRHDDIVGLPGWADTETYDVTAKVAATDLAVFHKLLPRERNPMLQSVLTSRFHLACHYETREMPVYNLVIAKGGLNIVAVQPHVDADGHQVTGNLGMSRNSITADSVSLAGVADLLTLQLGRTVIDRSGSNAVYSITVHFAPVQAAPDTQPEGVSEPSIFSAMEEQLGLRLEPGKGPVKVLAVGHIERPGED